LILFKRLLAIIVWIIGVFLVRAGQLSAGLLIGQDERASLDALGSGSSSEKLFRMRNLFKAGRTDSTPSDTASEPASEGDKVDGWWLIRPAVLVVVFDRRIVKR
jgi:hypothetical protein